MSSSPSYKHIDDSSQPSVLVEHEQWQTALANKVNGLVSLLKHLLCLIFPMTTFLFLSTGLLAGQAHSIMTVIAWTSPFWLVLWVDWRYPNEKKPASTQHSTLFFDGILVALTVLQLANIGLMLAYVNSLSWDSTSNSLVSLANLIGIRFLVGTSSGTSGIVVGHELIHRRQPVWQWLGRLLLCTVGYEHFVITHKRGHHQNLGMPDDIATAKLGESFKAYWRRIYLGYLKYAWRSEQERLSMGANVGKDTLLQNKVLHGLLVEWAFLLAAILYYGWLAAIMFAYQAWVAVRILEAVNYFQHWGLENGQFGNTFGWVSRSWISRYALIGLSHHIGHHQDEHKRYYEIAYSDQGPLLPYGYFVMNLWVKLGNDSYQKMAKQALLEYQHRHSSLE